MVKRKPNLAYLEGVVAKLLKGEKDRGAIGIEDGLATAGKISADCVDEKGAVIPERVDELIAKAGESDWLADRALRLLHKYCANHLSETPAVLSRYIAAGNLEAPPKRPHGQGRTILDRGINDSFVFFLVECVMEVSRHSPDENGHYYPLHLAPEKPLIKPTRNETSPPHSACDIVGKAIGLSYANTVAAYRRGRNRGMKNVGEIKIFI